MAYILVPPGYVETNFFFTIRLVHHLQVDGASLTHPGSGAAEVPLRNRLKTIRYEYKFFQCLYRVCVTIVVAWLVYLFINQNFHFDPRMLLQYAVNHRS